MTKFSVLLLYIFFILQITLSYILIQQVYLFVKVLKSRSLLIKLSPRTWGPKNYSGPQVLTFYFYFYVRFHTATAVVVDGGGIFGIWRVGEEIWVHFFSWSPRGGVLGVLIGGSEPEWEMRRTGWGDRRGALCTEFTLVIYLLYTFNDHTFLQIHII